MEEITDFAIAETIRKQVYELRLNRQDDAILAICDEWEQQHPDATILPALRAEVELRKGNLAQAQTLIDHALTRQPSWEFVQTIAGQIALERKEWRVAIHYLTNALEHTHDPARQASLYYQIGFSYWQCKELTKAQQCFKDALKHQFHIDSFLALIMLWNARHPLLMGMIAIFILFGSTIIAYGATLVYILTTLPQIILSWKNNAFNRVLLGLLGMFIVLFITWYTRLFLVQ